MRARNLTALLIALLVLSNCAFADTVALKSGRRYTGDVTKRDSLRAQPMQQYYVGLRVQESGELKRFAIEEIDHIILEDHGKQERIEFNGRGGQLTQEAPFEKTASGDTIRTSVPADTLALLHMWRLSHGKPNKGMLHVEEISDVAQREAAAAEYLSSRARDNLETRIGWGLGFICGGILTVSIPTEKIDGVEAVGGNYLMGPIYLPRTVREVQPWQVWLGAGEIMVGVMVLALKSDTEREYHEYKGDRGKSSVGRLSLSVGPGFGGSFCLGIAAAFSF
jgi:hypothetical protein